MSQKEADKALMASNFNQLEAVRQIKKDRIEVYFSDRKKDMANLVGTVDMLRTEAFNKMEAGRESRKKQIERYFGERYGDISVLAANDGVRSALEAFTAAFEGDGGKTGGTIWNAAVAQHAAWLEQYNKEYGYYDLFLISKTGDVVYTAARESDLGANLPKTGIGLDRNTGGSSDDEFERF